MRGMKFKGSGGVESRIGHRSNDANIKNVTRATSEGRPFSRRPWRGFGISFISATVLLLFLCAHAGAQQADYVVTFQESDVKWSVVEGYDLLEVDQDRCTMQGETGKPFLPVKLIYVAIPYASKFDSFTIQSREETDLGYYRIIPTQATVRPGQTAPFVYPDVETYALSTRYPASPVEFAGEGAVRETRIVTLKVYPLQYIPATNQVVFNRELVISVKYTAVPELAATSAFREDDMVTKMARAFVDNARAEDQGTPLKSLSGASGSVGTSLVRPMADPSEIQYLIITGDALKDSFQPLADWKTKKGVPAEVVTTSWIYANYEGSDNQEKIKRCIQDYVTLYSTFFVLLGGDDTVVPDRDCYTYVGSDVDATIPTDLYYASLDSINWNTGGGYPCEPADNIDLNMDVWVGRAPVRTTAHATAFVNKTIAYDKNPATSDFAEKMLLMGDMLWSYIGDQSDAYAKTEAMYDDYIAPYWDGTAYMFYDTATSFPGGASYDLSPTNMITQFANGYNYIFMATHGNANIWATETGGYFSSTHALSLTNASKQGHVNTIACITNKFDGSPDPCLSEAFLRNPNGGAVSYVGSSRYGWGYAGTKIHGPSFKYADQIYKMNFDKTNPAWPSWLGVSFAFGKMILMGSAASNGAYRWLYFSLNLMGDPELYVHDEDPQPINAVHAPTVGFGSQTFTVSNCPPGAWVCLLKEGEIYEAGFADDAGVFSRAITPTSPGTFYVTVTNRNYTAYEGTVEVSSPGPPVVAAITDDEAEEGLGYVGPTPVLAQGSFPITWTLSSGPAGMTIDSASGVVSWANPALDASPASVTIRATNALGFDEVSWAITVRMVPPVISSIDDHSVIEGQAYTGPTPSLVSGSTPITWSLEAGHADMAINASNGVVTWENPDSLVGSVTVTIRATNDGGYDDETWTLTVEEPPPVLLSTYGAPTQSSTYTNGSYLASADKAIDADTDGDFWGGESVTSTQSNAQAWWELDLGAESRVRKIVVYKRTDNYSSFLSNFYVLASADPFASKSLSSSLSQAGVWSQYIPGEPARPLVLSLQQNARYVRVQLSGTGYLQLAEVEVWGLPEDPKVPVIMPMDDGTVSEGSSYTGPTPVLEEGTPPITWSLRAGPSGMTVNAQTGVVSWSNPTTAASPGSVTIRAQNEAGYDEASFTVTVEEPAPDPVNLAGSGSVSQSSTYTNGSYLASADKAVDGNTDGDFWNGQSVSGTQSNAQAWWELDLGAESEVRQIIIYKRTDAYSNFLSNIYVLASADPFVSKSLSTSLSQAGVWSQYVAGEPSRPLVLNLEQNVRYVRVQLSGTGYLQLAEVQVWGIQGDPPPPPEPEAPVIGDVSDAVIQAGQAYTGPTPALSQGTTPITWTLEEGPSGMVINADTGVVTWASPAVPAATSGTELPLDQGQCAVTIRATNEAGYDEETWTLTVTDEVVDPYNVAEGKTALQSSTYSGRGVTTSAALAVDGDTNGDFWNGLSVSSTQSNTNAWWEVDLGEVCDTETIRVYKRTDAYSNFLSNFYVIASETPFDSYDLQATLNQAGVWYQYVSGEPARPLVLTLNRSIRYIRVQLAGTGFLQIAELQAWGLPSEPGPPVSPIIADIDDASVVEGSAYTGPTPSLTQGTAPVTWSLDAGPSGMTINTATGVVSWASPVTDTNPYTVTIRATNDAGSDTETWSLTVSEAPQEPQNLAEGKSASQSSTYTNGSYTADAGKAVDGNTGGDFWNDASTTSTTSNTNAWWQVDLGGSGNQIETVTVWKRTDKYSSFLSNFWVFVSDVPFTSTNLQTTLNQAGVWKQYIAGEPNRPLNLSPNVAGRYVRVQLAGTGFLQLAEVQVWGYPAP